MDEPFHEPPAPENPTQARMRRMAAWKASTEEWLEKRSKGMLIAAMLMTVSIVLSPFGLALFLLWSLAHLSCALADILPHLRFSLGGLFLAVVTFQIPLLMLLELHESDAATWTAALLFAVWFYVVGIRLHHAILAARAAKESRGVVPTAEGETGR